MLNRSLINKRPSSESVSSTQSNSATNHCANSSENFPNSSGSKNMSNAPEINDRNTSSSKNSESPSVRDQSGFKVIEFKELKANHLDKNVNTPKHNNIDRNCKVNSTHVVENHVDKKADKSRSNATVQKQASVNQGHPHTNPRDKTEINSKSCISSNDMETNLTHTNKEFHFPSHKYLSQTLSGEFPSTLLPNPTSLFCVPVETPKSGSTNSILVCLVNKKNGPEFTSKDRKDVEICFRLVFLQYSIFL